MILFVTAVVSLGCLTGYVVGEVRGIRIGWDRATAEHDGHGCPDDADSDLRDRQYQQEHDELATLGGDL